MIRSLGRASGAGPGRWCAPRNRRTTPPGSSACHAATGSHRGQPNRVIKAMIVQTNQWELIGPSTMQEVFVPYSPDAKRVITNEEVDLFAGDPVTSCETAYVQGVLPTAREGPKGQRRWCRVIIDLFAGPGGWDEGFRMLDTSTPLLGYEIDRDACDTAVAAGHPRIQGDLTEVNEFPSGVTGLIASSPCPGFSAAGKGLGRKDLEILIKALPTCDIEYVRLLEHDHRSSLTLEPMRWILQTDPTWIAMEQVPAVLPLWQAYAEDLTRRGYSAWAGYVYAEQFGVPQTRKRAALLAHATREVHAPVPTHSRYYPRDPTRLDPGVLPWVSMAEALGRGMGARPSPTVTGGGTATGGAEPIAHLDRYANRPDWITHMGDVYNSHGCVRPVEAPSPTLTASMDNGNFRWVPKSLQGNQKADGVNYQRRSEDQPAQTLTTNCDSYTWVHDRPSTTVMGDPRISPPGRHDPNVSGSQQNNSIRVSVQEAGVLQSFPPRGYYHVDMERLTRDEAMVVALAAGWLVVDPERGEVRSTRGPGGLRRLNPPTKAMIEGYRVVSVKIEEHKYQFKVARLVWTAVHGLIPQGMTVDHRNNNKLDNRISNLQLLTSRDNIAKAFEDGLHPPRYKIDPSEHEAIVEAAIIDGETHAKIAERYGVTRGRISQIVREQGYPWSGTKSSQYLQVGNAIPPLLAAALLRQLL